MDIKFTILTAPGCVKCKPFKDMFVRVMEKIGILGYDQEEIDISKTDDPDYSNVQSVPQLWLNGQPICTGCPGSDADLKRIINFALKGLFQREARKAI